MLDQQETHVLAYRALNIQAEADDGWSKANCHPKVPFKSQEPVSVPLISQMCDELKRLPYAKMYTESIALLV